MDTDTDTMRARCLLVILLLYVCVCVRVCVCVCVCVCLCSAVYVWDADDEDEGSSASAVSEERRGFAACFVVRKEGGGRSAKGFLENGYWEAIHVVQVGAEKNGKSTYQLSSTVNLSLESGGGFKVCGSITRANEAEMKVEGGMEAGHVANMGRMVEDLEGKLRSSLELVYFGKTREVIANMREAEVKRKERARQGEIAQEMRRRGSVT